MEAKEKCPKCERKIVSHGTLKTECDKGRVIHNLFYCSTCKLMFKVVNGKIIENYNLGFVKKSV